MNTRLLPLYWFALLGSLSATAFGIYHLPPENWLSLPWVQEGAFRFAAFSVVVLGSLSVIAFVRPQRLHFLAAIALLIFSAGTLGVSALVVVLWIAFSSWVLGRVLVRVVARDISVASIPPLDLLLGLGIYATFVGLLAHFKVNYTVTYVMLLTVPLLLARHTSAACFLQIRDGLKKLSVLPLSNRGAQISIWYLAFIYLATAAIPEIGHDALAMHMMVPAYIQNNHLWSFDVTHYIMAVIPMNGAWLFSLAYVPSGEYGARLLNVALLALIVWLMNYLAKLIGASRTGWLAVLMFLSMPLTFLVTGSLFVENVWTAFLLGAIASVIYYIRTNQAGWLKLSALLCGLAVASKLTALLMLPLLGVVVLMEIWRTRNWRSQGGGALFKLPSTSSCSLVSRTLPPT